MAQKEGYQSDGLFIYFGLEAVFHGAGQRYDSGSSGCSKPSAGVGNANSLLASDMRAPKKWSRLNKTSSILTIPVSIGNQPSSPYLTDPSRDVLGKGHSDQREYAYILYRFYTMVP